MGAPRLTLGAAVVVIFCGFLPRLSRGEDESSHSGCRSYSEHLVVECQGLNASSLLPQLAQQLVPSDGLSRTPSWVQELKILDSRLPVLSSVAPRNISALRQVQVLQVIRCQVQQVTVEAMMQVAPSLRHLSLAHNKLVAIPAAVSLLDRLEVLNLQHNAIIRLSPLLARLPRLRQLMLDHNRIMQITGWSTATKVQTLPRLTHLGLADNLIHELWDEALSGLSALQSIDLSKNHIQRLSSTLCLPPSLMELDLRDNPWRCDCESTWLTKLQYRRRGSPSDEITTLLPTCSTPTGLRSQPLAALTEVELCHGIDGPSRARSSFPDVTDRHMNLSKVEARSFQLTWNVSNISMKGKKIQEYLGWRVTFRKFGDDEESEVLLITLAGEDASRKTGTSSGHYNVQNLTPATGYLVCFQTLTDNEVNNIIESQNSGDANTVSPLLIPLEPLREEIALREESPSDAPLPDDISLNRNPKELHPLTDVFREEWESFWKDRLEHMTTTDGTTSPLTATSPPETEVPTVPTQNFVYTNTGQRIRTNFVPPGTPVHHAFSKVDEKDNESTWNLPDYTLNDDIGTTFIRNVPPPPPPFSFGEKESKFPFPFVRKKRSLGHPVVETKGRCLEVLTEEEDEIIMPVSVAATASSTTMVILLVCCCCFPKRCNKMRNCCVEKCKSAGHKVIIKTNSKTKTYVKPSKKKESQQLKKSMSVPDLRLLTSEDDKTSEYNYPKLNKYYTMRGKDLSNTVIELFPGYDLPKSATAKYFGYDFPKENNYGLVKSHPRKEIPFLRRMSTDDNVSPIENDRFLYYNLNKFNNLNIPSQQCKYSEKIKGIHYAVCPIKQLHSHNYQTPVLGPPRKISNREYNLTHLPTHDIKNTITLSRSEPDLSLLNYSNKLLTPLNNNHPSQSNAMSRRPVLQNNPGYELSLGRAALARMRNRNLAKSHDAKLEIVKHFDQDRPRRPTLLNLSPLQAEHGKQSYAFRITSNPRDVSFDYSEPSLSPSHNGGSLEDYPTYQNLLPEERSKPPLNGVRPIGEVAVTGGTMIEVPEGYVFPAKPRPVNVLRLKVPADPTYSEV